MKSEHMVICQNNHTQMHYCSCCTSIDITLLACKNNTIFKLKQVIYRNCKKKNTPSCNHLHSRNSHVKVTGKYQFKRTANLSYVVFLTKGILFSQASLALAIRLTNKKQQFQPATVIGEGIFSMPNLCLGKYWRWCNNFKQCPAPNFDPGSF